MNGLGTWDRRWCFLNNYSISFWKYPEDEYRNGPLGTINLTRCVNESVTILPRDLCARKHTLELLIYENQQPENLLLNNDTDQFNKTKCKRCILNFFYYQKFFNKKIIFKFWSHANNKIIIKKIFFSKKIKLKKVAFLINFNKYGSNYNCVLFFVAFFLSKISIERRHERASERLGYQYKLRVGEFENMESESNETN